MSRSLLSKRRELTELKELTKHLKSDVHAKKQNIATLEELLRTAGRDGGRTKPRRRRDREHSPPRAIGRDRDIDQLTHEELEDEPKILHFFVSTNEGLCVEFNEPRETTVANLIHQTKQVFDLKEVSQELRSTDDDTGDQSLNIKLVLRGRILIEDSTLAESNIRPGDTVIAVSKGTRGLRDGRMGQRQASVHLHSQQGSSGDEAFPDKLKV